GRLLVMQLRQGEDDLIFVMRGVDCASPRLIAGVIYYLANDALRRRARQGRVPQRRITAGDRPRLAPGLRRLRAEDPTWMCVPIWFGFRAGWEREAARARRPSEAKFLPSKNAHGKIPASPKQRIQQSTSPARPKN